uniref:Pheromone and odorant receptor n=1 Tax=Rhipicephalus appendiculatus TaxID=34631 RepID=A0A131YFX7_RHIAP
MGFHAATAMQLHKSISRPRSQAGSRVMSPPLSAVLLILGAAVLVASPAVAAAAAGDPTSEPACPAPRRGDDGVLLEPDADVFLGAFVQAHEPARDALLGCGSPLAQGVETLELFKWAVGLLNRDQGFVPGVKIGMRVFDSCGHKARAYLQLDALLPVLRGNSETCVSTANSSRVIGTLMTSTLRNEELIAGLLRDHDVPTIPLESSAIAPPEYLAKLLLEAAFDMKWEHFAVLHSHDEPSVAVVKALSQRAVSAASPCVTLIEALPKTAAHEGGERARLRLRNLLVQLEDATPVFVVTASADAAEALAELIASDPDTFLRHRQWFFAWVPGEQALRRLGPLLNRAGFYALAPYPPTVGSFEDHWNNLSRAADVKKARDRWYLELVATQKHCRILGLKIPGLENAAPCPDLSLSHEPAQALVRTSRALPAARGVFTLAQALRSAWKALCRGQPGLCPELRRLTRSQFAGSFLEPGGAALTLSRSAGGLPAAPGTAPASREARAASDVLGELGASHLALTRFLYDAVKGTDFKQLILYDSEEAKLLQKDTRFMPALCSADTCQNCIRFRTTRLEEADATITSASSLPTSAEAGLSATDIVLPVLLPLHNAGHGAFGCGDTVNRLAVQDLEAASWMVRKINSNGVLLPRLKLELRAIDTCSSASVLTRDVTAVLEHFSELGVPTVFVSSSMSAEHTRVAASILSRLNVTLVTTTDLAASHDRRPGYLYQIPLPIEKIAEAAVTYLQSLDWSYVSVVSSESESRAVDAFKERADAVGICLAIQATLTAGRELDPNLIARLTTAAANGARAVVLWTDSEDTLRFLAALRRARTEGLLDHADLVLIHGGGQPVSFDGHEEDALGAVLLRPQYKQVLDFESYYERLRPDQNRFFSDLWSQARTCHRTQGGQVCSVPLMPSRSVVDVMQAVLVAATALRDLREQVCGGSREAMDAPYCARLLANAMGVGEALDEQVRQANTMRVGDKDQMFVFTERGHGDIAVDLWNVRRSAAGIAPQKAGHLADDRFTELMPVVTYGGGSSSEVKEVALNELRSACQAASCRAHCAPKAVDFLVVPSPDHVYLAAAFSVHERGDAPFRCSHRVTESGVRRVEAFLWALDQINASPSVLPGVKVGAVVFDVCGSREKTYRDLSNFASDSLASFTRHIRLPALRHVFGFVASGRNNAGQCTVKPAADVLAAAAGVPTVASDSSLSQLGSRRYPSLLRVLPSNAEVAQAVLRVLRHFKWTYVSAVYDDRDDELQDVWEQFERALEGGPLRLATTLHLKDDTSDEDVRATATQLLRRRREGARVVVLFLKDKAADALLTALHEASSSAASPQPVDLTFVALGLRDILSRHPDVALGSLSLRLASVDVPGFRDHVQHLSYASNGRNPWYRAYVEQKTGCRGPAACANALTPPLASGGGTVSGTSSLDADDASATESTVTAVFALASGLDQARKTRCAGDDNKPCELSMDDAYRNLVINFTRNVRITRHDGSVFKFADGNSGNGRVQVTYYRSPGAGGMPGEFSQIGTYNRDEGLQMNASLPEVSPGRSPYTVNSSCEADGDCRRHSSRPSDALLRDAGVQPMLSGEDGPSLAIGAVLPVHRRGSDMFSCGGLHEGGSTFQSMLAVAYALDRANQNRTDDLRLDAVVFDSCGTPQRAESLVYGYMTSSMREAKAKPLVSMITFENKVAEEVAPVLKDAGVPLVLTSTTSRFTRESRPVGIQTLPPIVWQVEAALGLLRHYDWSYVYFLYSGDEFGQDAYYHVTKSLARLGLCVADSQRVDPDATEEDVLATVLKLTDSDVRVVVVLAEDKEVSNRIAVAARRASLLERFVWVGTEGFSDNERLLETLHGADVDVFSLRLDNEPLPDYARFVSSLTLGRHEPIPDAWFEEFWQLQFGCRLPNARRVHEQFARICTGREKLEVRQDRYVYHTVDTVTRIAAAVRDHVAKNCPAALAGGLDSLEGCKKSALRREVSVTLLGTDLESCSECQPSTITTFGYRVLKMNGSSVRNYTYQNVGSFFKNVLFVDDGQVDFFSGVAPMSTCVRDCDERCPASIAAAGVPADNEYLRQHRESLAANFRTVWGIVVTALSLLGMVLVIICALYFLMAFPVTVGTTVLGYMILVGLLALYAVNFAFVVGATEASCGVRRFLMGLAYSIIFSGMLVKVLNTWRLMGYHQRMHHDTTQLSSPAGLLVIACGLVVIQVVLTAAWLVLMPPRIGLYERVWRCAPPASFEDELVVSMVYVMLLLAVTILFSVLTWPCRENNGESRWILACCVSVGLAWLAWTVLGTQLPTRYRDATIAVANLVCATLVMLCLYLRKVYLYNKLARQARDQEIKARLQPRGPPYTPSVYGTLHKAAPTVAPVFYGSQGTLTTSKKLNGQFSRLSTDDLASDGSGSVQVQGADLYPLEMYDGGSQFQPPSSLYGSMMMLDDNVAYAR